MLPKNCLFVAPVSSLRWIKDFFQDYDCLLEHESHRYVFFKPFLSNLESLKMILISFLIDFKASLSYLKGKYKIAVGPVTFLTDVCGTS